jgi:ADP-heptose:LPS heptosyltransferase
VVKESIAVETDANPRSCSSASIGSDNAASLVVPAPLTIAPPRLSAGSFCENSPLHSFFEWNEARHGRDRRHVVACDAYWLLHALGGEVCLAYLVGQPLGLRRAGRVITAPANAATLARQYLAEAAGSFPLAAAQRLVDALLDAIGSSDSARHAIVFRAFEELAAHVDLDALARLRPRQNTRAQEVCGHNILVIKLGALGDFIQALGPVPEIRRHHAGARLTLLTTPAYVQIARRTGLFDNILVDRRPRGADWRGWLALRRMLRAENFDRVYDFQTSDRSNFYSWLLRRGRLPEWSGTAWRCSHPHANRQRDEQHTMDRQAEQLMMAGVYPVATAPWLPLAGALPPGLGEATFALLVPGSSPHRLAKRWPTDRYAELAGRLSRAGYRPVVVGGAGEEELGREICAACPKALDLVGRTDVAALSALAQAAAVTVSNDTGAAHVAAAGRNPVVVLFSRESKPSLCAPRGGVVRVLAEPDLADLSVETVFEAAMTAAATATASHTAAR